MTPSPLVTGLSVAPRHHFSKESVLEVRLVAGHGVEGDAHAGATVQHRSRKRWRPHEPNLRQVHLLPAELLEQLRGKGYDVAPGRLGENVTTSGVDLLALHGRTPRAAAPPPAPGLSAPRGTTRALLDGKYPCWNGRDTMRVVRDSATRDPAAGEPVISTCTTRAGEQRNS